MKIKGRFFQSKTGTDTILVSGDYEYEYVLHQDDSWEKVPAIHTPDGQWMYGRFDIGEWGWECETASWDDEEDVAPVTIDQFKKMGTYGVLKTAAGQLDLLVAQIEEVPEGAEVPEYYMRERMALQDQLHTLEVVLRDLLGKNFHFTRTDAYYGVCTEDEEEWLFKVERGA